MTVIKPNYLTLIPDGQNRFSVVDLRSIGRFDSIPFDPGIPVLLVDLSPSAVSHLSAITEHYHRTNIRGLVVTGEVIECELGQMKDHDLEAAYIPPLCQEGSFDQFRNIIARLRAPEDGCPWDTKQTIRSLRKNLLEECYEALEVIDSGKYDALEEELGDLLLIIVMIARIGEEEGIFDLAGMLRSISKKMIRRHPHIFGDAHVDGVEDVFNNWDQIKKQERVEKDEAENGILDGVPRSTPALSQGQQLQDRAARVGFDWPDVEHVIDKVVEEAKEVKNADNADELEAEIGDLLFVLVNFARWKKVDAETALQRTNQKFRRRFSYIERRVYEEGKELTDKTLDELDAYWNEAKRLEIDL